MRRRTVLLEFLALAALATLALSPNDYQTVILQGQRVLMVACQQAARAFGTAAIKLEASYRVKVAP